MIGNTSPLLVVTCLLVAYHNLFVRAVVWRRPAFCYRAMRGDRHHEAGHKRLPVRAQHKDASLGQVAHNSTPE